MNFIGQQTKVEGEIGYRRDGTGAWVTTRTWRGNREELLTFADELNVPCEISQEAGPMYRLTATYSGQLDYGSGSGVVDPNTQVAVVWNFRSSTQRADLWELPKVKAELLKIADVSVRAVLLSDLRSIADGTTLVSRTEGTTTKTEKLTVDSAIARAKTSAPTINEAVLREFVAELALGIDGFLFDTFVLRKRRIGPGQATSLVPAFRLRNLPLSTAELLAAEPTIPASYRAAMSADLANGFWLRNADELDQQDADKVVVTSQWVFGTEYSQFIYKV